MKPTFKSFFFLFALLVNLSESLTPTTYYANVGETVRLQCVSGGGSACFSTYTFQNTPHQMVMLNNSRKYQVEMSAITINNVQATDAGFYACSSNCNQMKADQISYFLQPMTGGQPVDVSRSFIAIPPFPRSQFGLNAGEQYIITVDERLYAAKDKQVLTAGEIAGLVIGLVAAFLITCAVVGFIIFTALKRRKNQREKILDNEKKEEKDSNVDYSTIERDYHPGDDSANNTIVDRNGEKRSLTQNKADQQPEINTRNIKGPNTYKLDELIGPNDLPNIDLLNNKTNSQRSNQPSGSSRNVPSSNQGSYNVMGANQPASSKNPSLRNEQVNLPPPPANNRNNSKIQFPNRNNQQPQQPRYVSNENINLQNIIKESGFISDMLDNHFGPNDDKTGSYASRNPERQYSYNQNEQAEPDEFQRHVPQKGRQRPSQPDINDFVDPNENLGGVTVVSARQPVRQPSDQQTLNILPPTNRSNQPQSTKYSLQQPANRQNAAPHLSFSQRIETTSTPLQLPASASLRGVGHAKDGATDV